MKDPRSFEFSAARPRHSASRARLVRRPLRFSRPGREQDLGPWDLDPIAASRLGSRLRYRYAIVCRAHLKLGSDCVGRPVTRSISLPVRARPWLRVRAHCSRTGRPFATWVMGDRAHPWGDGRGRPRHGSGGKSGLEPTRRMAPTGSEYTSCSSLARSRGGQKSRHGSHACSTDGQTQPRECSGTHRGQLAGAQSLRSRCCNAVRLGPAVGRRLARPASYLPLLIATLPSSQRCRS